MFAAMFPIRKILATGFQVFQKEVIAANSKPLCNFQSKRELSVLPHSLLLNLSRNITYAPISDALHLRSNLFQGRSENIYEQQRSVTQYSRYKGKRRTVKNVLKRFYRLDWGIWIRTICGRQKRLYKKSSAQKRRYKQHVFCNAQQSTLLDKMVTKFWKKPKYFVDDPYEPYHRREEFVFSRKQPFLKIRDN